MLISKFLDMLFFVAFELKILHFMLTTAVLIVYRHYRFDNRCDVSEMANSSAKNDIDVTSAQNDKQYC